MYERANWYQLESRTRHVKNHVFFELFLLHISNDKSEWFISTFESLSKSTECKQSQRSWWFQESRWRRFHEVKIINFEENDEENVDDQKIMLQNVEDQKIILQDVEKVATMQ